MAEGSENEVRGLNALGNPDRAIRTGSDRGPTGSVEFARKPGSILARGQASSVRKGMGGAARGEEKLRSSSR